jgi:hypothetical protein
MAAKKTDRRGGSTAAGLDAELDRIGGLNVEGLRGLWRQQHGCEPPAALSKDLLARALAYRLQEEQLGGLDASCRKLLGSMTREGAGSTRWLKIGTVIVRSHGGVTHEVMVTPQGFCWRGQTYSSLSTIALRITGTSWNGARFFGLTGDVRPAGQVTASNAPAASASELRKGAAAATTSLSLTKSGVKVRR